MLTSIVMWVAGPQCDLILFASDRTFQDFSADLSDARTMGTKDTLVFMHFDHSCTEPSCTPAEQAWQRAIKMGQLRPVNHGCTADSEHERNEIHRWTHETTGLTRSRKVQGRRRRGWCIGQFAGSYFE